MLLPKHFLIIRIVAIVALFIAVPDLGLPYGYFQLLRFLVCGISAYSAYQAFEHKYAGMAWFGVFMTILFNPILPIHLTKEIWMVLNLIAIAHISLTFHKKYRFNT